MQKNNIDWGRFAEESCLELRCKGICCEWYQLEQQYLKFWIRQQLGRGELLTEVEFIGDVFAGIAPAEQLLWGRTDWKPSVQAALCLMDAGVSTVDEFLSVGFYNMEKRYELQEEDAEQLRHFLCSIGHTCRRPRGRSRYDDFRPRR